VSPVKYELGVYIPEDDILHSHCREMNPESVLTGCSKSLLHRGFQMPEPHGGGGVVAASA
jgi:hypothetical protein